MKKIWAIVFCFCCCCILYACKQDCHSGINMQPMYGRDAKCKELLAEDEKFISEVLATFPSKDSAARYHIAKGWGYYYEKDYSTAMKRFNQAWLLDSNNADIYWGFGVIAGQQQKYKESIDLLERALTLKSDAYGIWESIASSYGQYFFITKDNKFLEKTIESEKRSIALNPDNANGYAQLAAAYAYYTQKDSAKKYMAIAEKIDSNSISAEVRAAINN